MSTGSITLAASNHIFPAGTVVSFYKRDAWTKTLPYPEGAPSGVNEVQQVGVDATSGNYTLTYSGQTTANIAYNADAATIQTRLENLSNIAVGDVEVTGTNPFYIRFTGDLAATDITLTKSNGTLAGGGAAVTLTELVKGVSYKDGSGGTVADDGTLTATITQDVDRFAYAKVGSDHRIVRCMANS